MWRTFWIIGGFKRNFDLIIIVQKICPKSNKCNRGVKVKKICTKAIKSAAKLAELDKYNLVDYPKYEEDFESMILGAFSQAQSKFFQNPLEKYTSEFIELSLMEGIQTRIPYSIKME